MSTATSHERTSAQASSFRRVAATLTIGSFSVAALMGIIALLGGGDFGEGEGRVLLTTLIVGCASICALSYLATTGTRWARVGALGGLVLVVPVTTALVLVWSDWGGDSEGVLKTFGIGVVLAVTCAQICLLLALAGDGRLGAVLWSTVAVAVLVGCLVSAMIVDGLGGNDPWRVLGVLAILDVLGTVVTIALSRFSERGAERDDGQRLRVSLDERRTAALARLAAAAGVSSEDLVTEAVDRLLAARADGAATGSATGDDMVRH